MLQISILGCGWLGFPLAEKLIKNDFSVNGSTTSFDKLSVLENAGIRSFQILISENKIDGDMNLFLEDSDVLIIDFPPKLRGDNSENYVSKIKNLIPFIEISSIKKVLFVSSTSVYSDDELILEFDEESKPQPDSESGKQLLEVEKLLQNNSNFKTTIVRFGGLFGEDRHPIKFLAGRKNLENPDGPINLIHQLDCIGIIEEILQQAQNENYEWNEVFNAVAPFHPSRKDYYSQKSTDLNLALPEFDESKTSIGKIIKSSKIELILNYKFKEKP